MSFVYKQIEPDDDSTFETWAKSVFHEICCQVILQTDTIRGDNICHIFRVYRHGDDKHPRFWIQMERLDFSVVDFINRHSSSPEEISEFIRGILPELNAIIAYFHEAYGFSHRDLHAGNVMLDATGRIKLIDFGKAYLPMFPTPLPSIGDIIHFKIVLNNLYSQYLTSTFKDSLRGGAHSVLYNKHIKKRRTRRRKKRSRRNLR